MADNHDTDKAKRALDDANNTRASRKRLIRELHDVLRRHEDPMTVDDARDVLGNLAMVFAGQESRMASGLLNDAALDLAFFHGIMEGVERRSDAFAELNI